VECKEIKEIERERRKHGRKQRFTQELKNNSLKKAKGERKAESSRKEKRTKEKEAPRETIFCRRNIEEDVTKIQIKIPEKVRQGCWCELGAYEYILVHLYMPFIL
jgi:hypothetical protein